jgi:hypothetical protein
MGIHSRKSGKKRTRQPEERTGMVERFLHETHRPKIQLESHLAYECGEFKFEVQHPNKKWGQVYFFSMGGLMLIISWTQLPKERV